MGDVHYKKTGRIWRAVRATTLSICYAQSSARAASIQANSESTSYWWKLANSTACIKMRHYNGSCKNSEQEISKLLEMTFQGSLCDDERFTPAFQPQTQTRLTGPFTIELEFRHALENLNHRYDASLLKGLSTRIALVLARSLTFPFNLLRFLTIGATQQLYPLTKYPPPTTDSRSFRPISLTAVVVYTWRLGPLEKGLPSKR